LHAAADTAVLPSHLAGERHVQLQQHSPELTCVGAAVMCLFPLLGHHAAHQPQLPPGLHSRRHTNQGQQTMLHTSCTKCLLAWPAVAADM
jgi:hypothetical protein